MLGHLIRKEILDHILSLRFYTGEGSRGQGSLFGYKPERYHSVYLPESGERGRMPVTEYVPHFEFGAAGDFGICWGLCEYPAVRCEVNSGKDQRFEPWANACRGVLLWRI